MKIIPANKTTVYNAHDLPDMSEGVMSFFQNIIIELIYKQNNEGFLSETPDVIHTQGVRFSQSSRELAMKPEGERKWKWSTLYLLPEPPLKVDDKVRIFGIVYRVMSSTGNTEYNVCSYELIEDYDAE